MLSIFRIIRNKQIGPFGMFKYFKESQVQNLKLIINLWESWHQYITLTEKNDLSNNDSYTFIAAHDQKKNCAFGMIIFLDDPSAVLRFN